MVRRGDGTWAITCRGAWRRWWSGCRGSLKDNESRIAPINDTLLEVRQQWKLVAPPGDLMFAPAKGVGRYARAHTLYRHLKLALAACRLPSMTWYQCTRHTFASHFIQDGGSIEKLSLILGHADIATTQRYAHLVPGRFDRREFGAACVDLTEARVMPFNGSKNGTNSYASATQGSSTSNGAGGGEEKG